MFFKREGIPEEGDLVLCTVKKILFHSVFVSLDEYRVLEGMVHISEVAPGRIRNLRDYIRENKQIICKVLRIDRQKGHIDLSLRRVNPSARAKKLTEYKQEEKAEKILEQVAKRMNTTLADIYDKAGKKIIESYGLLSPCLHDLVLNGDQALKQLNIPENYSKVIVEVVKEKISLPEVKVSGYLNIQNFSDKGVILIRDALAKAMDFAKKSSIDASITYISAPSYKLDVKATEYKSAEDRMRKIVDFVIKAATAAGGSADFSEKQAN